MAMSEPATPAAEAPSLTCPRHKVATPLSCSSCGTPICPQCYVRTAVGLRCPTCAQGIDVKIGGRRKWPFVAAGAVVVVALLALLLASSGSDGGSGGGGDVLDSDIEQRADGAARGYKLVANPQQGYSVEVPDSWLPAADNSDATLSYSLSRASEGSLRVSVNPSDLTAAQHVERLIGQLTPQGGQDFAQAPVQVGDERGVRLTYRFPTSATPGSSIATHYSTIVKHAGKVYSLQLSTTDPASNESAFGYIQSSFKFL